MYCSFRTKTSCKFTLWRKISRIFVCRKISEHLSIFLPKSPVESSRNRPKKFYVFNFTEKYHAICRKIVCKKIITGLDSRENYVILGLWTGPSRHKFPINWHPVLAAGPLWWVGKQFAILCWVGEAWLIKDESPNGRTVSGGV